MKTINCIIADNSGSSGGFSSYKWVGWNYNNNVLGSSSLPGSTSNDGNAYRGGGNTSGATSTTFTGTYNSTHGCAINTLTNDEYYGSSGNVIPLFYPGESVRFRIYCPSAGTTSTNYITPAGNVQDQASTYNLIDWYGSNAAGSNPDFYNMYDTGNTNSLAHSTATLNSGTRIFATTGWYYYQIQFTVPNRVSWRANSGARGYGWVFRLTGNTGSDGYNRRSRVIFDVVDVGTYSNINLPNYTVDPNASQLPTNWNFTGGLYPLQYRGYRYSPSNRWVVTGNSDSSDYFYSTSGTSSNSVAFPANQILASQGEIPSSGQTHSFRVEARVLGSVGGFYANTGGAANNIGQWQFSTTQNSEGWYEDGETGSLIAGSTSYSWGSTPSSINEGSTGSFGVNSSYSNLSTLYWRVVTSANGSTVASGDFSTYNGTFSMTTGASGSGTVNITPSADTVVEGTETFYLQIHDSGARTNKLLERSFQVINTTVSNDTEPDAFNLGSATVSIGTTIGYSNIITISGTTPNVNMTASITGTHGQFRRRVNSSSSWTGWRTANLTDVQNGHQLQVRIYSLTTSLKTAILSVGSPATSDTFSAIQTSGITTPGNSNYGLKLQNNSGTETLNPTVRVTNFLDGTNDASSPYNSAFAGTVVSLAAGSNLKIYVNGVTASNTTVYQILITNPSLFWRANGATVTRHNSSGSVPGYFQITNPSNASFAVGFSYQVIKIG